MKVTYELPTLGFNVNPVKREDISLQINHDQEGIINNTLPNVTVNNLYFAREEVKRIVEAALMTSPGITEGIPFHIKLEERDPDTNTIQTHTVEMYLDLMDGLQKSNDGIFISAKMLQSKLWLDDKVDAFTFESMYNETGMQPFQVWNPNTNSYESFNSYQEFFDRKTIYIPYVISTIPNYHDAFLALFGITYIANELYKVSKSIIQWSTPVAGVGVVLAVAQLVLEIAYAVLLITTLLALVEQLIKCLIQPIKYHGAMLMSDLFKIVAVKLGLKAQSSIWDNSPYNRIAYLPEKFNPVEGNSSSLNILGNLVGGFTNKGYTSPGTAPSTVHNSETPNIQHGYFNGTGGDFLRLIKTVCNGKIIIPDGTNDLVLERRDYFPPDTPYKLPDIRQDWNGYNTDELIANIILKFQSDLNDRNCIDHISNAGVPFYPGTILQATHQQIQTLDKALVCLKGLREIQIAAARGVAKDKLTFVEQAVKDLKVVWDIIALIALSIINTIIVAVNVLIAVVNVMIFIWNAIIFVLRIITDIVNVIIDVLNTLPGVSINRIEVFDNGQGTIDYIDFIDFVSFDSLGDTNFSPRLNALLLENDMLVTPKLLLVDTARAEFTSQRIAYIHADNTSTVHAKHLWDKFYFIDAFVGTINNRRTKISPALNKPEETNEVLLSLQNFKRLVNNPRFHDSWDEEVEADSIEWHIERNGAADFAYRKKGWLKSPQNPNAQLRSQEIAVNLQLKISVPNGN